MAHCISYVQDVWLLYKPNTHSAVELCGHTIPFFSDCNLVSEMGFELAHRRQKCWLEPNTSDRVHVTGVERTIACAWVCRVCSLYNMWCDGDEIHTLHALLVLQRLLLSMDAFSFRHGDCVHWKRPSHHSKQEFCRLFVRLFCLS